jgi:hypothetical protein
MASLLKIVTWFMIVIVNPHQNKKANLFIRLEWSSKKMNMVRNLYSPNCNFINLSQDFRTSRRNAAVALECISFDHTLFKESSLLNFYQHNQLKLKVFGSIISPSRRAESRQRVDLQWTRKLCWLWSSTIFTSLISVLFSKPETCWNCHSHGRMGSKSSPHEDEWLSWWPSTGILLC